MYQKALSLSELVGGSEERPRVCSGQRNRENYPAESAAQYWKRMPGGNTIPWRNLLRTQKSLQQGKEGTLWALCSYSSSNHVYVWGDHSRTCASTAWEVGPSDAIAVIFRKWTVSMDEPLEATGSIGLWIHLGLLTISETRRQHLFSKREGTSKNSRRLAYGEHGGWKVIFLYLEDPYLASQHNDHRTSLRFSRHRHACKCSYHR